MSQAYFTNQVKILAPSIVSLPPLCRLCTTRSSDVAEYFPVFSVLPPAKLTVILSSEAYGAPTAPEEDSFMNCCSSLFSKFKKGGGARNSGTNVRTFPFLFLLPFVTVHLLSVEEVKHLEHISVL